MRGTRERASSGTYTIPECYGAWPKLGKLGPGEAPSCTKILKVLAKPALVTWAAKVEREHVLKLTRELGDQYLRMSGAELETLLGPYACNTAMLSASDIGQELHHLITSHLMREAGYPEGVTEAGPAAVRLYDSWVAWAKSRSLVPEAVETTVWSVPLRVAGTLDFYGYYQGRPAVIDWKSSSGIYLEHRIQVCAYVAMAKERGIVKEDAVAMVARLPKSEADANKLIRKTGFAVEVCSIEPEEQAPYVRAFRHCRELIDLMEEG